MQFRYGMCWDTFSITTSFLCAQQGQTATITASSPGLSGLTDSTSDTNSIYSITNQIVASLNDTGSHVIKIIATDNSSPPLTDSVSFTLFIKKCDTTLGINQLSVVSCQLSVFPNPSDGLVNFQCSTPNTPGWSVEVYNVLGEEVVTQCIATLQTTFTIDLRSKSDGVYFYRVLDETGSLTGDGKFVIQK
jgi:hypothetical protein